MTTTGIQQAISSRFDQAGTSIPSTSTEWIRRMQLINQAEDTFRRFLKGQWSFLFKTATLTATGNQAIILPSDFDQNSLIARSSNNLYINDLYYRLVGSSEINSYNVNDMIAWLTGNAVTGYSLNIRPTLATGTPIPISYYSKSLATNAAGDTDKPFLALEDDQTKIPDPYYIVDWVLAELFSTDDEVQNKYQRYEQSARDRLISMADADGISQNQASTIMLDIDEEGYSVFGSIDGD